jgi:iron uptake system component EfeO
VTPFLDPATNGPQHARRSHLGRVRRRATAVATGLIGVALVLAACGSSGSASSSGASPSTSGDAKTVNIVLTPDGCTPKPTSVPTGQIQFNVSNKNAGAVSEAELRTSDLAHILGEQENLTPGLSGGFSLVVQPGKYVINCPGATEQHATLTVTGKSKAASWTTNSVLAGAVSQYATYVNQNVASLITSTQAMCNAINPGNLEQAQELYPQARVYYERIEPVAEVWGTLDAAIDARIDDVANPADFEGFHKLEQLMWANNTLVGAPAYCSQLVQNQQQLQQLVATASYDPVTMASGATDLINEAATSKITGEEERYSNTDFIVFQANVDGAMEVFNLLKPALQQSDPALVSQIEQRYQAVESAIAKYQATPGYDNTGYVEYSTVLDPQRRQLSGTVQAFAEALSKMSAQVS